MPAAELVSSPDIEDATGTLQIPGEKVRTFPRGEFPTPILVWHSSSLASWESPETGDHLPIRPVAGDGNRLNPPHGQSSLYCSKKTISSCSFFFWSAMSAG